MREESGSAASDRLAGAALISTAAVIVFAMAHHPTGVHGGALSAVVHGAMIALLALQTWGYAHFAVRRGLDRPTILAGLVAFAISLIGHVGAATINGFIVPAIAARGPGAVSHDIFLFAWDSNQALARLGVFATGAAYLLWSVDFLRRPGRVLRAVGLAGLVAGGLPAALLWAGAIRMDVSGAFIVYAVHAAWAALVGLTLIRGEEGSAPTA